MYVELKTGYDLDKGPAWIARVRFSKTAYFHGRTLRRSPGLLDANFYDVDTQEEFWVSGPKRDRTDGRYSVALPEAMMTSATPTGRSFTVRPCRDANADSQSHASHRTHASAVIRTGPVAANAGAGRTARILASIPSALGLRAHAAECVSPLGRRRRQADRGPGRSPGGSPAGRVPPGPAQ